jgi:protoporphyrin/coproporphyrin ferrochelatase
MSSLLTVNPATHAAPHDRTGVLLVNLGTPDAPTASAVRRYLKEFLADRRVVEIPRLIWWMILNLVILNTRPGPVAKKYASVWMPEGSPLRVYTERQASIVKGALATRLPAALAASVVVEPAMRYGNPSLPTALAKLAQAGCSRIVVLPLYPQYASSTTGSTLARVSEIIATWRTVPALRTVARFHDHPAYIKAMTDAIEAYWMRHGRPDHLLMSFHGLPRFHLDKGDPYHCECLKTARLIRERLGWPKDKVSVAFQSRFGRAEWLKPYTTQTLQSLGKQGLGRLDVCCPGFAADCLETLEEIAEEGRHDFQAAGGGDFHYIPVANDQGPFIEALIAVVMDELSGWIKPTPDAQAVAARVALARERGAPH